MRHFIQDKLTEEEISFIRLLGSNKLSVSVGGTETNNVNLGIFTVSISGGNGIASTYLTSDGLIKSSSNTFLYSTVLAGWSTSNSIPTAIERPIPSGFAYNSVTGLAQWAIMESKTTGVLVGGSVEGLEIKEDGFSITCIIIGIN